MLLWTATAGQHNGIMHTEFPACTCIEAPPSLFSEDGGKQVATLYSPARPSLLPSAAAAAAWDSPGQATSYICYNTE